ncbi:MAG: tripartite tricarboxylate transporter TctB family protein [Chloroflexota bacterium]|nr:tripartite tricarboxylate transporter TctB family protein [Chloroflexota bacterium]
MRPYQVGTAAFFIALAAAAMLDTRKGALVDTTGTAPGGIGAGFYPFWSAALIAVAGVIVAYVSLARPQPAQGVFRGRESVVSVLKLIVPMVVATTSIIWLGFYLVTGLYMGFFARFFGHYRWIWVAVITLAFPLAIYAAFELGFRVSLPKSIFYNFGLPF